VDHRVFASSSTVLGGAIFDVLNARPQVAIRSGATRRRRSAIRRSARVHPERHLGIAIFVWIGWGAERFLGWRGYAPCFCVSGIAAAALC
jgi:hypothetical protein